MSKRAPWAIYIGYEMDINTFRTFIDNFPDMKMYYTPVTNYERIIMQSFLAYRRWRFRLAQPLKKQVPPILFVRTLDGSNARNPTPLEGETRAFFFPVRYINYYGEEQFEEDHPDFAKHAIETETDQAKLNAFIEFIENQGGVLNRDMIRFASLKERHPKVHPTLY